ncbi:MAG: hypothetical protein PHV11_00350 [Candidatus Bipolaricaulis sp.]|nr:hypothetical protein [Candidatus Bipolaricaulis sp.]
MWHKLTIVVPKVGGSSNDGNAENTKEFVAKTLSSLFGGATIQDGQGVWVNEEGVLVKDDVWLVWAFADPTNGVTVLQDAAKTLGKFVKADLSQDTVMTSIEEVHSVTFW